MGEPGAGAGLAAGGGAGVTAGVAAGGAGCARGCPTPLHDHPGFGPLDEGHRNRAQALSGRILVDEHRHDPLGNREIFLGAVAEHPAHVADPDRHRHSATRLVAPEAARTVVADPDAGREPGREADEPRVRVVVGRPRLGGHRAAQRLRRLAGPALHDAAEHVGDHVGGLGRHRLAALRARAPRGACPAHRSRSESSPAASRRPGWRARRRPRSAPAARGPTCRAPGSG